MAALQTLPIVDTGTGATPCQGCHAGCCRAFAVPLSGADIHRIIVERQAGFWDFVCRWEDKDGQISRQTAPRFHFDDAPETPFVIGLRQVESERFPGTRKCLFLDEGTAPASDGNAPASCSIYASRPATCRVFPFRFEAAGRVGVQPGLANDGGACPPYALCPSAWNVSEFQQRQAALDLSECLDQMQVFHLVAEAWNAKPGPWALFPEYLREIYALLAPSSAA